MFIFHRNVEVSKVEETRVHPVQKFQNHFAQLHTFMATLLLYAHSQQDDIFRCMGMLRYHNQHMYHPLGISELVQCLVWHPSTFTKQLI